MSKEKIVKKKKKSSDLEEEHHYKRKVLKPKETLVLVSDEKKETSEDEMVDNETSQEEEEVLVESKEPKQKIVHDELESVSKAKHRADAVSMRPEVDAALADIYSDGDGSIPDMSTITKQERHRFWRAFTTFVFACLFLGGALLVGLFVLQPKSAFSEQDVIISVSGDDQVRIGDEVHYRIRYVNAQELALSQSDIHVRYPEGFVFTSSSVTPDTDRQDRWTLGTLDAQESGFIDIYGTLYGSKDQEQSLRVFFTYTPENFSSPFQKVSTVTVTTKESPVRIAVEGPTQGIVGGQHAFTVTIDQLDDQGLTTPMVLEVVPNGGFIKKESQPDSDQFNEFRWTLSQEEKNTQVQVQGSISGDGQESITIPIRVIGWKDGNQQAEPYIFDEYNYTIALVTEDVVVSAVVNGATEALQVQPGETLNLSISLKNAGDTALENVQVQALFDAPSFNNASILNWTAIEDAADGDIRGEQLNDTTRRGVIRWAKEQITPLTRIGPHDEQIIDIALPIRNADQTALANFTTFTGTITIDVQYSRGAEVQTMSSKPITFVINSDTNITVRDQVSEENGKDVHSITWVLENNFHALKDIRVVAEVYGNTTFDEARAEVPAGSIAYDKEKKKLSWTVDTMPISVDILPFAFRLIREDNNASQTQLMSKVEFRATDTVTGEQIILVADPIGLGE